jgi:hypothetical protein
VGTLLNDGFKVTGLDAVARAGLPFETRVANRPTPGAAAVPSVGDAVVSSLPST